MAIYSLRDLWVKACEYDGIDPESKFVVFSDDNPWMRKYNLLACIRVWHLNGKDDPAGEK